MDDRRVSKHRRTLNERRSSGCDNASAAGEAPLARPGEKPRMARVSEELMRLTRLWQAGALNDAEFEAAKARVLATYWNAQSSA